jgi:sister-chromatid-cohesion protein PDS5
MIQSLLDMLGVADEKDDVCSRRFDYVLSLTTNLSKAAMETEEDWSDDVSTGTQAKILMIKVCTNRCLALRSTESAAAITTPVIRMLFTILELNGLTKPDAQDEYVFGLLGRSVSTDSSTAYSPKSKSRLRLQAAISLLHLSSVLEYCRMITANFILLALTMQASPFFPASDLLYLTFFLLQDTCYQVRRAFLDKLTHYLLQRKLDPLFNVIAFLTPHDPEQDIRDKVEGGDSTADAVTDVLFSRPKTTSSCHSVGRLLVSNA